MATNQQRYVGNLLLDPDGSKGPLVMLGLFDAGASTAVKRGELLEKTGTGNTVWVPMDSDYDMTGSSDAVAIAHEEIKSGDLAGYYEIIVPRPGDMFEFDLAAAGGNTAGTAIYYSDSETVTITAGTNILGNIVGQDHYPLPQGHASDGDPTDRGTTIRSVSRAVITIQPSNSYYSALQST